MFTHERAYGCDISRWDVSGVADISGMLSKWDVLRVTSMQGMFFEVGLRNSSISKWDVFFVADMIVMFVRAQLFDGDFSKQDVAGVTSMSTTLQNTKSLPVAAARQGYALRRHALLPVASAARYAITC